MNFKKTGGTIKLLAFSLVAVIVVLTLTVAASGLQIESPDESTGEGDGDNQTTAPPKDYLEDTTDTAVDLKPKYYYYLTGLECDEESTANVPYAFVTDSLLASYGISLSALTVEIPVESGATRLLVFNDSLDMLGKIGTISAARSYISDVALAFGANLICYGTDDLLEYSGSGGEIAADLSEYGDFCYKEGAKYVFTNKNMISALSKELKLDTVAQHEYAFNFTEPTKFVSGILAAADIRISYSEKNTSELKYDSASGCYAYYKNGVQKTDALTAEAAEFENVFVLFADSCTYERSEGVQTVIETTGGGGGYYCTRGKAKEIRWKMVNGELVFEDLSGETLVVNRGASYVGYFKSSCRDFVDLE